MLISVFLTKCTSNQDPVTGEKQRIEPNVNQRAKDFVDKGGGIMGMIGKSNENTNFKFSTSNVLWRATLKSLNFLPLLNADYTGGIIITDWYSEKLDSKESIKLTIKFLSNEIRSDSIEIIAHKKNCETIDKCQTTLLGKNFSQEIKDSIVSNARILKIEDEKKKK